MSWLFNFVSSPIGKKLIMSLSGLFFCLFLVAHIGGNLLLFLGADPFNDYVQLMSNSKFIIAAEVFMILTFLTHICAAAVLTIENRKARPQKYAMDVSAGNRTLMSSNMFVTGSLILAFVVFHIISFKFGDWSGKAAAIVNPETLTLYELVKLKFENVYYAFGYVAAMIVLGLHLKHAFQSAFQTLGINHSKYTPFIKLSGNFYSIIVALIFSLFPLYFFISQFLTGA